MTYTYQQRTSASLKRDRAARQEAVLVWRALEEYLEELSKEWPSVAPGQGLQVSFKQVPEIPDDLVIILGTPESGGSHSYYIPRHPRFSGKIGQIYLRDMITDKGELNIYFRENKKSFVHEYIHYLDKKRQPAHFKHKPFRKDGLPAVRNAVEFNAYYQSMAEQAEATIESLLEKSERVRYPRIRERLFLEAKKKIASFEAFYDFVASENSLFISAIEGTNWERKFRKRLVPLYIEMRNMVKARKP